MAGQYAVPDVENETTTSHNGSPDRFVLCSGGVNSVAMAHKMIEEYWSDDYTAWNKRPIVVYLDTTVGLSSQRLYVELLTDYYEWSLFCCRTHDEFESHTEREGHYGPKQHGKIFNALKGRQLRRLATISGNPHFYFGSLIEEKGEHIERVTHRPDLNAYTHNPILEWSEQDCVDYLRDRDVPYNPNWQANHFTDCGCGATATREELIELEAEGYEVFAQKLRELEKRVETGDRREWWGWGGFDPSERAEKDAQADPDQVQLSELACGGDNCSASGISSTDYPESSN